MTKKVLGVIPARLNSTRLPAKMLANIAGKPIVVHTYRRALKAKLLDELVVATDSKEIYDAVEKFGGKAVMADKPANSGSDRVGQAIKHFPWAQIIINIQGDEPLIDSKSIDALISALNRDPKVQMATIATEFKNKKELESPTCGKVILDKNSNAIYFSRSIIPYPRNIHKPYLKHIGLYGFRRNFLKKYLKLEQTPLEKAEGLEQLRILEHGYKLKVVVGDFDSISVDTQEDLERVRKIIK